MIKEEAPEWDEFSPSEIKEEMQEWDEFTPSEVKEEPVEFTSRPEQEELKAVEMIKE